MKKFFRICLYTCLVGFELVIGLGAEEASAVSNEGNNQFSKGLLEHSPFVPAFFNQSDNSKMPLPTVTTANYQLNGAFKMSDGHYLFSLTEVQSAQNIWVSSRREDNDPMLYIQFYTYDEENKMLVLEMSEGLVRIPLKDANTNMSYEYSADNVMNGQENE